MSWCVVRGVRYVLPYFRTSVRVRMYCTYVLYLSCGLSKCWHVEKSGGSEHPGDTVICASMDLQYVRVREYSITSMFRAHRDLYPRPKYYSEGT